MITSSSPLGVLHEDDPAEVEVDRSHPVFWIAKLIELYQSNLIKLK